MIFLSKMDIETIWRLGKCLDSGVIPVNDIRSFLARLQQKIDDAASPAGKRSSIKPERKNKYKKLIAV